MPKVTYNYSNMRKAGVSPRGMPGYKRRVPKPIQTYVKKEMKKASYSKQQVCVLKIDQTVTTDNKFSIMNQLVNQMIADEGYIFKQGSEFRDDQGTVRRSIKIKIDSIKWQIRFATGENETTDAVSQNIRVVIWRTDQQYQEIDTISNLQSILSDHDGALQYPNAYGGVKGVYHDRFFYVYSMAADSDTTAAGQRMDKGQMKLNYTDTFEHNGGDWTTPNVESEKGQLAMTIKADDPSGVNAKAFGYFEVRWRYLE